MRISTYLVLGEDHNGRPRVRRAVNSYPALLANKEAVVKLGIDIPDDVFEAPLFTVEVAKRDVAVAVEVESLEEES